MRKLFIALFILLLTGCSFLKNTPITATEDFLYNYQTLSEEVIKDLNNSIDEKYNDMQKEKYKEIMKEQYKTLTYKIKDDEINGNKAKVTTTIMVKDYYKTLKEAREHKSEFENEEEYINYELDKLASTKEKVEYTIEFNLVLTNKKWYITDINEEITNKLNGFFEY